MLSDGTGNGWSVEVCWLGDVRRECQGMKMKDSVGVVII